MKRALVRAFLRGAVLVVLASGPAKAFRASAAAKLSILPLRVRVGGRAPNFALPSANGNTVRLSDFPGHNVLIDFYRGYW